MMITYFNEHFSDDNPKFYKTGIDFPGHFSLAWQYLYKPFY